MDSQKIRIRLKAFDHRLLDKSASVIAETAKQTGAVVAGPIPIPTKRNIWTVFVYTHLKIYGLYSSQKY